MLDFDRFCMQEALKLARKALENGEIPVGAVVAVGNRIIGKGYNQVEQLNDPTAHAEMIAITAACNFLGNKYLDQATLYVTLEPCMMCMGALREAQIAKVIYGAVDNSHKKTKPHGFELQGGLLEEEASQMLKDFFKKKRNLKI